MRVCEIKELKNESLWDKGVEKWEFVAKTQFIWTMKLT